MSVNESFEAFQAWLKRAQATGALPELCKRVIIDIPWDGMPRVHVVAYADASLANEDLLKMVAASEPVSLAIKPKEAANGN